MKKLLTIIALTSCSSLGLACDCTYTGNFLKVSEHVDIIAIVKVTKFNDHFLLTGAALVDINQPQSMTVEVVKILKGTESAQNIKVFGDNGFLCRPYIDTFTIDKFYVTGLFRCKDHTWVNGITETSKDYFVSNCGDYWLEYSPEQNEVKGVISSKKRKAQTMTLDEFLNLLPDN